MLFPERPPSSPQGVFAAALGCGETLAKLGTLHPLPSEKGPHVSVSPEREARVHSYLGQFEAGQYACGVLGISFRPGLSRNPPDRGRLPTEAQAWSCAERVLKYFASGLRKRALLRLEEGFPARLLVAVVIPLEGPVGPEAALRILGDAFPKEDSTVAQHGITF